MSLVVKDLAPVSFLDSLLFNSPDGEKYFDRVGLCKYY